jgi:hypothetical protein
MLPLTFALFTILTGALIVVRVRWRHLSPKVHTRLIVWACGAIALFIIPWAFNWSTTSNHLNAVFYWLAIAGYEFFILLFTLLRPRWLSTVIAIVLLFPILSASAFLPLAELFNPAPHTVVSLGLNFIGDRVPWGAGVTASSGFDFNIYSQSSWAPFLRRRRQAARYYNGQCDDAHAFATLQPDGRHILMSCPAAPGQQPDAARNLVVKLY